MRQELSDSRRQLLELQQSVAEATRRRGQEILSWRSQRRQLEEETWHAGMRYDGYEGLHVYVLYV